MRPARLQGSIYDGFSPAGQDALKSLRHALQRAGFYAEKERATERTLRVYPERRGKYPLVNPRLYGKRRDSPVPVAGPSLVCSVYSDGDQAVSRMLTAQRWDGPWAFYHEESSGATGRYYLHGYVTTPLPLLGLLRSRQVDWEYLKAAFDELHLRLSANLFFG